MSVTEKKRIRFNVIDVLILLIAAGLIISTVMRYQSRTDLPKAEAQTAVEVKFLIENMSETLVSGVVFGESVYLVDSGRLFGTLKSADFQKAQIRCTKDDGTPVIIESDRSYDVRGVLTAEGIFSERGFFLGGEQYLAPGLSLSIRTPSMTADILITDISVMD